MLASWQSCFVIFTISSMPIHITYLRTLWRSKKLLNVGFFWHLFWFCFFRYVLCWLYPLRILNQYCETRSIDSSFFFLTMACIVCKTFQIIAKNVVLTIFLIILTWMCAYGHKHTMVTHIILDAAIEQWRGCLTRNILYPCFLCLLFLLMPMAMVLLAPFLLHWGSFFFLH